MKKKRTEFGKRLLRYAIDNDLSINDICEMTGIPRTTLNNYINSGSQPNVEKLKKLCVGLGVSSDYMIGMENDK